MKVHEIKYRREVRPVNSLRLHPIVETIGFTLPDNMYKTELKYLGLHKVPVITEDGSLLTVPDYLCAAIDMNVEYIDVLVIVDENEHTLLRLINFDNRNIYRGSKVKLYKITKLIQEHLWNTKEGRDWYNELPGENINEKIGALVGYSPSTISNIKYIGDKNISYLEKVDDPDTDMTLTQAKILVDSESKLNGKKDNYSGQIISSLIEENGAFIPGEGENNQNDDEDTDPTIGNTNSNGETSGDHPSESENEKPKSGKRTKKEKPKEEIVTDELTSFSVGYKNSGHYSLDFTDDVPMIIRDSESIGSVFIEPGGNNNVKEELRHVLLSKDGNWSFHIVATRINNTIKQKEVESNNE